MNSCTLSHMGGTYRVGRGLCGECAAIERSALRGPDEPLSGEALVVRSAFDGDVICLACEKRRLSDRQAVALEAGDRREHARLGGLLEKLKSAEMNALRRRRAKDPKPPSGSGTSGR